MPLIRASRDEDVAAITAIYTHHVLHGTGTFEIDPPTAQDMAARLLELGVYVIGFSFPVVTRGQARIRTQMSAAHTFEQIDAAVAAGADYVGFGPCYPTATKGYSEGLPAEAIEEAAFSCPVPLFAIGGIDASNLLRLRAFGVRRIAVSSAILKAQDPYAAAARLRAML
jgi:hypothetical protein